MPQGRGLGARALRVLYLDHCAQRSGAELALARLLPALRDVDAHVVLAEDGPIVELLRAGGAAVEVLAMPERSRALRRHGVAPGLPVLIGAFDVLSYARTLARRARALEVDLVVTNSLKAALYGGLAGRLARLPVLWHVHDRIAPDYLPGFAVALVRTAARVLPTAVVANSRATLATLGLSSRAQARLGAQVVGNACPLVGARLRRSVGAGPLTFGIVGRLAPWKGQDVFLEAFARGVAADGHRARVVGGALFGEQAYAKELAALVASLGVADVVELVGHVDDVAGELSRLDVLVHASRVPEPFGQVVVEAMALGVPVVATGEGGPAEIVTDGHDGLLCPAGDVDALADRLVQLAEDRALRVRLADAGRRSAERFAPERVAAEMERAYRAAAKWPAVAGAPG